MAKKPVNATPVVQAIDSNHIDAATIYGPDAQIEFVGKIQLLTNHSTTFPSDDGSINLKNKFSMRRDERKNWNKLAARGHTVVNYGGQLKETAFITSPSFKSLIRRAVAISMMAYAKEQGACIPMRQANALYNGHNSIKAESAYLPENIANEYANDPVTGTFGSWKFPSLIEIQDALPIEAIQVNITKGSQAPLPASVLNDQLDAQARADFVARRAEVADNSKLVKEKSRLEKIVAKAHKADMFNEDGTLNTDLDEDGKIADAIAELEEVRAQIEANETSGGERANSDRMLYNEHYTPAGTTFNHRMKIDDIRSSTTSAIVMFGLQRVAFAPRLGAHKSKGYGYFAAQYDVILHRRGEPSVSLGKLSLGHTGEISEKVKIDQTKLTRPSFDNFFVPTTDEGKAWWADCQANTSWISKIGS